MAIDPVIIDKLSRFCAYRDRCASEIKEKSRKIGASGVDELLSELEELGLWDEQRYASSFAQGKFRIKGWGRNKIKSHLYAKRVPTAMISRALDALDQEEYTAYLKELARNKFSETKAEDDYQRLQKVQRFLLQRGFEQGLIVETVQLKELLRSGR